MLKPFRSIRWRLVAIYLLIVLLAMGTLSVVITMLVEDSLIQERIEQQQAQVDRLALDASAYMYRADAEQLYRLAVEQAEALGGRVVLLSMGGIVQVDSASRLNGQAIGYSEVLDVIGMEKTNAYGFHRVTDVSAGGEKNWAVYYTARMTYRNSPVGVALLSVSIQDVMDKIHNLRVEIVIFLLAVCLAVGFISFIISEIIVKPILEMTRVIRNMAQGDFTRRIKIGRFGHSEISDMARAFNGMSEQLSNLEQSRNEFVANASHELKTPLSSMKIMIQTLLLQPADPEMTHEFLSDVDQEIDRLNNIINDLLSLAKADASHVENRLSRVNLKDLLQATLHNLEPLAQRKQIDMEMVLPEGELTLQSDPIRLQQAISNIIDNAIKYTPEQGSVRIEAAQQGARIVIWVQDTGYGISPEDQKHIFDRFYRVDKARSRATGGTGLGLAIVKQIITGLGGSIRVESQEGEGSTFTVELPIEP
ncbi:ATP-binding protein [Luoshenia tenuis]|jgi:two-component system OmpR family sensor kinase|uniref:ATP-binding protein n=1 Tax=Luoshenia tenuis TaxID=2763654 RepID=UPI003D8B4D10